MTWSIVDGKIDEFKTSEITASIAVIIFVYFCHVSVNILRHHQS